MPSKLLLVGRGRFRGSVCFGHQVIKWNLWPLLTKNLCVSSLRNSVIKHGFLWPMIDIEGGVDLSAITTTIAERVRGPSIFNEIYGKMEHSTARLQDLILHGTCQSFKGRFRTHGVPSRT
jgi:hypothetical protein